ncbi:MAG: hypothetical protein B2I17_03365 [Thermoplasmatales archaeon B_DKE]|nr:MAG: hypothetical protein B2I17_03365 [Thermoplasmatales archaeon B_DKE]
MGNNDNKDTAEDAKRKFREAAETDLYFPGPKDVYDSLLKQQRFKAIKEIGTDREDIWYFNRQIYERGEEFARAEAHELLIKMYREMLLRVESVPEDKWGDFEQKLFGRLKAALHNGPREGQINEVLAMIRRTTFTDASEMNPLGYIPFKNGLLDLNKRTMTSFTPELFYTYQVDANFLDKKITLLDTPLFTAQLNQVFFPWDIPLILAYFGYCLYPDLPVHKVLGIFGRERVGKGTLGRVLKGLLKRGLGSFHLARILTADRFPFTGIAGKNVLVDFELKRKFKRGTVKDWSAFNNLFGQDILSVEDKGKEAQDRTSKAKGIVIGNLPIFPVDDAAAIERWLPVITRNKKPGRLRPNVDDEIISGELDQIATILVRVLFGLIDRNWIFPWQLTSESTVELMDKLADPVENFIEECTEPMEGAAAEVNRAYDTFVKWCNDKGITAISAQMFKRQFGWTYKKKRYKRGKDTGYEFIGCALIVSEDDDEREEEYQDHFQDGTGSNFHESRKNGFRGTGYRQFQHVSSTPRMGTGKGEKYKKDHAHKLEPGVFDSKNPENKAPHEIKGGSNLQTDPVHGFQLEEPELQPNPVNSDAVSSKTENSIPDTLTDKPKNDPVEPEYSMTEDEAKKFVSQLSKLGFHPDPAGCGVGLLGKTYHIELSGPSDSGRLSQIEAIMSNAHFTKVKEKTIGMLAFEISLRREQE